LLATVLDQAWVAARPWGAARGATVVTALWLVLAPSRPLADAPRQVTRDDG